MNRKTPISKKAALKALQRDKAKIDPNEPRFGFFGPTARISSNIRYSTDEKGWDFLKRL